LAAGGGFVEGAGWAQLCAQNAIAATVAAPITNRFMAQSSSRGIFKTAYCARLDRTGEISNVNLPPPIRMPILAKNSRGADPVEDQRDMA
jgi:hypothetical protein